MPAAEVEDRYRVLSPERITETIELLKKRIEERFPGSGLGRVCGQLLHISRQAQERARWIAKPIRSVRIAVWVLVTLFLLIAIWSFSTLKIHVRRFQPIEEMNTSDLIQALDAGTSELLVVGAGVYSLVSLEKRIKRNRALVAIHEIRAIAHIIDMHQLTKDPERLLKRWIVTEHSPPAKLSAFELARYLDYCSEMMSLTGKVAALYVQEFDDSVAITSVNEVENLTTGLSRKIWQKIMLVNHLEL